MWASVGVRRFLEVSLSVPPNIESSCRCRLPIYLKRMHAVVIHARNDSLDSGAEITVFLWTCNSFPWNFTTGGRWVSAIRCRDQRRKGKFDIDQSPIQRPAKVKARLGSGRVELTPPFPPITKKLGFRPRPRPPARKLKFCSAFGQNLGQTITVRHTVVRARQGQIVFDSSGRGRTQFPSRPSVEPFENSCENIN